MVKDNKNTKAKKNKVAEREARLSDALRANLRRRKQQAREQKTDDKE